MGKREEIVLTSNEASIALGKKIADQIGLPFTVMERRTFADGERWHAFPEAVERRDLVIVGATHNDVSFQELLDLISGGRFWNARSIRVVIPFLGYSTMERAKLGVLEIPKGVTRTRQLFRTRPDCVYFVDLHSEAVLHAHGGEVSTHHIQTDESSAQAIASLGLEDFVLVSPDYGFSKRVARLASLLGCSHTAADKDRFDTDKTIVSQVSSVVSGKTAIICDDMIRTGGSILQTAERCLEAGATQVYAHATHLVLAADAGDRFAASPIVKIIGSDSYPDRVSSGMVEVYSIAPLLAKVLRGRLPI